jgi:hemerythrin-like domain-containing protein
LAWFRNWALLPLSIIAIVVWLRGRQGIECPVSSSTDNLLQEHLVVRRLGNISQKCSERLYANQDIPIEDIQIISVVIEEFVDAFHHGKEEKAYFPATKNKDGFSEDIRKFLIEHELGRRIAGMLRRELDALTQHGGEKGLRWNGKNKEPVARFLKSYAVFISDHTGKEDTFFKNIVHDRSLSREEEDQLARHYEICRNEAGGQARMDEMIRLIGYLETRDWIKQDS